MATTKAIGNISKTKSVPSASIGTASVNLDTDTVFNNKVAGLVRWAAIAGTPTGTVQFASSLNGTNFTKLGSATTLTTAGGEVLFEDSNFEGKKLRLIYTFGDETDATGTIDVDFLADKPL